MTSPIKIHLSAEQTMQVVTAALQTKSKEMFLQVVQELNIIPELNFKDKDASEALCDAVALVYTDHPEYIVQVELLIAQAEAANKSRLDS
jgi:hypothetical protein